MAFFPGKRTKDLLLWMLSTKMMPAVGVLIPIYLLFRDLGAIDSRWGLTVVYTLMNLPIVVWMLYTFFKEVPKEILEAGRMDGAKPKQEVWNLLLPLSLLLAVLLMSQGVIQNFDAYRAVATLEGGVQTLAMGPVASQEAIKLLGTNGGGFFNANSAHPFENPTALSNFIELLAIFLGSGTRGKDAVASARQLLVDHGPLRALLERGPAELAKLPGLGPARASRLASALELCDRYLAAGLERGEALTDPKAAGMYFAQRLRSHPHEVFAALFLDTRHRALAFEELFRGTIDGAEVHPREVVRRAGEAGIALTPAGATHPYATDPRDSTIRIAPTYPELDELELAISGLATCVRLVATEKLLEGAR